MAHRALATEQDRVGEANSSTSGYSLGYPLTQSTGEGQLAHRASRQDGHTTPSPESLRQSSSSESEGDDESIDSMRYLEHGEA